jgi:hypothetical protein
MSLPRLIASDLHKEKNACVLNAVFTLRSDLSQAAILEAFLAAGYKPSEGCWPATIFKGLETLGVKTEGVPFSANVTAYAFAQAHPTGCYFVTTGAHAFAIIGGRVIDPYYGKPQARGRLKMVLKVVDAVPYIPEQGVAKKTGKIRCIVSQNPKRKGTATWKRFNALLTELYEGRDDLVSVKAATGYTDADLAWDVKHGFLVIEEYEYIPTPYA